VSNPFQRCSICSAPPEVLAAVNEALRKREKFRDLAERTGFSRASLHRHSKRCVPRDTLAQYKARTAVIPSGRTIVAWPARPDQPAHYTLLFSEYVLHESDLLDSDTIFRVSYAPDFSVEVAAARRTRFSDKLLDEALAENEARTPQTDS